MPTLRVLLLGGLEILSGEDPLPAFPTRRAASLFAFLVLHPGRSFSREALSALLWGGMPEARARRCLRTTLWRVRTVLRSASAGAPEPEGAGGRLGFAAADAPEVDVHDFEQAIGAAGERAVTGPQPSERQVAALEQALALYRGDLLEGLYDEWIQPERERLRLARLGGLETLLRWRSERREWDEAVLMARSILQEDPLREHVHRALMVALHALGDRPSAVRHFHRCRTILDEELGVDPMPETVALYRRLLE